MNHATARYPRQGSAWTPEDRGHLEDLLERHVSYAKSGLTLGRTAKAVRQYAYRGLGQTLSRSGYSLARTALIMGVCRQKVSRWVARGALAGRRLPWMTLVSDEGLTAFCENPAYWSEWSADAITVGWLRTFATDLRSQGRWYTTDEAAAAVGLTLGALTMRIRKGDLAATRQANGRYLIAADALAAFAQGPLAHPRLPDGRRPFTTEDIAFLKEWRPVATVSQLARAVDHPNGPVWRVCHDLGLTGPKGHGGRQDGY